MKYLIILWLLIPSLVFAQIETLKGKVIDSQTHSPLPDANILVQGTDIGTASEKDGSFTLSGNFSRSGALIVSFIG